MNRRIVLIDQNETPNVASFYGIGLGDEIYTLQALTQMNPDDLRNFMMSLGKGDAIMLVGGEPFKFLQQFRHPGVRSENYFDCSKLYRLSWEGDLYTKIVLETPEPQEVQEFMSPDFTRDVDFSWFKSKIIHTLNDAHKFFDWLEKLPEDEYVSLDYEASGMTLDVWFELSGFSICNLKYGAFVSLTDLRHNSSQKDYAKFMERVGKYLDKKQDHIVCYNIQYEQSASHRMFGVYLYNLLDASVANVLDGEHYKKLSLKHTAQRVLKAKVWDTEFDWISDTIDSMLYTEEGKLKKDKHKVLKVTPETFEQTDEWKAICARYPGYIDEFKSLMLEYFGSPFMVIPSEILGKYCNLDAFYTLLIFETKRKEYSEDAIRTFMDNARLGAVLHNCGLYIDEPFRQEYSNYCRDMMAWGITTCAEARCYIKMEKHKKLMAKIDKYSDVAKKLLYANKFFNGDPIEITKYILTSNVDYLNTYELGLDEGKLLLEFGPDFAEQFIEKTREAMEEAEMIKLYKKTGKKILKKKIDDTVKGKKKLIQLLSQKIIPLIGLDKIKINNKHIELEKYLYYERAYNELMNISRTQLNDINNIPKTIRGFGIEFTNLEDYANYVSDNYFKSRSPEQNSELCLEFAELYRAESAYLAAILESTQQLDNAEKFYSDRGIDTIDKAFGHFASEYNRVYNGEIVENTSYPEKMYSLFDKFYKDPGCDEVKEIWSNFNGYIAQEQFFGYVNDQYQEYGKPFKPEDLNNRFFFMRKLVINYLLNKKYAKVLSTYIDGLFNEGEWVIEDKRYNFPIRKADPSEPGAIRKCFSRYEVNTKSSKR